MRPALNAVRVTMSRGAWPAPLDVAAMLRESRCDPGEARDLVSQYTAAVAPISAPSGEASVLAALRSFSLGAPD